MSNGVSSADTWESVLKETPSKLSDHVRKAVASKAKFKELNFRDVAWEAGLGYVTVMNFIKKNHGSTTDTIDALAKWSGYDAR